MNEGNLYNLKIYVISMEIGEKVFALVTTFDQINKNTIGLQMIRAVDSISANIAEGYGRFHYKDRR